MDLAMFIIILWIPLMGWLLLLFQKGLIYKDKRLVNWDTKLLTAVSDLEVQQIEIVLAQSIGQYCLHPQPATLWEIVCWLCRMADHRVEGNRPIGIQKVCIVWRDLPQRVD